MAGGEILYSILTTKFGRPYGEEAFAFLFYMSIGGFVGFVLGIIISLIIIERLGRKWGSRLNFGSHPVLKLTFLSFLTFLGLLVLLLFLIPSTP